MAICRTVLSSGNSIDQLQLQPNKLRPAQDETERQAE